MADLGCRLLFARGQWLGNQSWRYCQVEWATQAMCGNKTVQDVVGDGRRRELEWNLSMCFFDLTATARIQARDGRWPIEWPHIEHPQTSVGGYRWRKRFASITWIIQLRSQLSRTIHAVILSKPGQPGTVPLIVRKEWPGFRGGMGSGAPAKRCMHVRVTLRRCFFQRPLPSFRVPCFPTLASFSQSRRKVGV